MTLLRREPLRRVVSRREDRKKAVVVRVRNRVELVAVAAGTGERHAKRAGRNAFHQLEQCFVPVERQVGNVFVGGVEHVAQKAGRRQQSQRFRRVALGVSPVDQFVAGNLLDEKPVPRRVTIRRFDDVIAIPPVAVRQSCRVRVVIFVGCVDIANRVEPVPAPPFSVVRRCQQPINQMSVSVRAVVGQKLACLLRSRRKACQIKVRSPKQRQLRRVCCKSQPAGFEFCEHKLINRRPDTVRRCDVGRCRRDRLLKRPELSVLSRDHAGAGRVSARAASRLNVDKIDEAAFIDPFCDRPDFGDGERLSRIGRRHLSAGDFPDEHTLIGKTLDNHGTAFAAANKRFE